MSKKYEQKVKKYKRKVKRVPIPQTFGDYLDNMVIDLKNYTQYADKIEKDINKLRWYGFQINDNLQQMVSILQEHRIYKSVRDKVKL